MAAFLNTLRLVRRSQLSGMKCLVYNQPIERCTPASSIVLTYQQKRSKMRRTIRKVKLPSEPKNTGLKYLHKRKSAPDTVEKEDPDTKYVDKEPKDDVWITDYYPRKRYTLLDAVRMHREAAVPEILNNEEGILFLNCTLDFRTKKKTKFLKDFVKTVVLPHHFTDGSPSRVMVICNTQEDKEIAFGMGAEIVGGREIIKAIDSGEIKHDDYDHCVCTFDILPEVSSVRKHLRDRFPTQEKGSVGIDVAEMIRFFTEGKTYGSYTISEGVGKIEVHFAKLNMTDEEIVENFETVIATISSAKSPAVKRFIKNCELECPPSRELFMINENELVPKVETKTGGVKSDDDDIEGDKAAVQN